MRFLSPSFRLALCAASLLTFVSLPLAAAQAVDPVPTEPAATEPAPIAPSVIAAADAGEPIEFLVLLEERADLSPVADLRTKEEKGRFVYDALRTTAARSQAGLLSTLRAQSIEHRAFHIVNMVWVRGDLALARRLSARPEVAAIEANPSLARVEPAPADSLETKRACPDTLGSGVAQIDAPAFWSQGIDGSGVVVAGQDTGYEWTHPLLRDAYLGWNSLTGTADHDYAWHDAIHVDNSLCDADSPEPCDDHGHGTHTMGTMIGDDGAHALGVAPGAKWMACRNMNRGDGTPASYGECYEWFLAPTRRDGTGADPSRAPDVINNSWSCPDFEGCTDPDVLREAVEALRAAGVVVVVSAGNSGSACGSINTPSAIYSDSFTVGSVSSSDTIASSSSRGPVTVDGSGRLKPDVSAPGVSICSSHLQGGFATLSGTSMAGPHVAGLVALLIDAQPCLRGNPDAIERYIRETVLPRTTSQACGVPSGAVPNGTYGWGVIRAVLPGPEVCDGLFADGFESAEAAEWSLTTE